MFNEPPPKGKIYLLDACKAMDEGRCPFCQKPINMADFRDELSRREYEISGICQECQDETFGDE
jgi:uncharacterized CHY-type Zn-finger protein